VGVGSTRASSWVIAVIGSTGLAGAVAMGGFLLQAFMRDGNHLDNRERQALTGAKLTLIITLVPISVAGTLVDFGALNAVLFAMTAALAAPGVEALTARTRRRAPFRTRRRPPLVRTRRTSSA
jgi:hypothetical protein